MASMKTVSKIDPEKEYENAKKIIEEATKKALDPDNAKSLDSSVDNLITAARVLMEREERRRGKPKKEPKEAKPKGRKKGTGRKDVNKLPSDKFPDIPVEEKIIEAEELPVCPHCKEEMSASGLFDTSEKLEVRSYTKNLSYN